MHDGSWSMMHDDAWSVMIYNDSWSCMMRAWWSWMMHDHPWCIMMHDSWGFSFVGLGGWVKNLTARNLEDMLGDKIGTKRVPVVALNISTSSNWPVFRCEAVRDDQRSPKGLFWVETADFRVNIFGRFFVNFWGAPTKEKPPNRHFRELCKWLAAFNIFCFCLQPNFDTKL